MNSKRTLRQVIVAAMLLVAFLVQGTWALAGTTGGLNGQVTDTSGQPVAGAAVRATSASQTSDATTDNSGRFVFLSLSPDTYTVSVTKAGFNPGSTAGVAVFADNSSTLSFKLEKALKEIGNVSARATGALVKSGTTSDVYSVSAATAQKITGLGGGGGLDSAYSALATVPGAYIPVGQAGWYQAVYVRGGDYDQVGYEVDGVPVNRAFDNYPSNTASALGQQEVQLYTGAAPSNAEGQGLSGFINQVIRTGTHPGFASSDLGLGSPIFYHKLNGEVGGASPDRNFSYYVGVGGYNQDYRTLDNNEGRQLDPTYGTPFNACPAADPFATTGIKLPGCYDGGAYQGSNPVSTYYVLGPYNYNALSMISDRENVANLHFALPHKKDSGRDDIQLLYQASDLKTFGNLAPKDWGTPAFYAAAGVAPLTYSSSHVYTGGFNQLFAPSTPGSGYAADVPYGFPQAPSSLAFGGLIPQTLGDSVDNAVGIVKAQYQKNFSSNAYLRVYGYTVYSNWFNYGPNSNVDQFSGGTPTDYDLFTHTRGVSATFADQINSKNLLQLQGSYSSATSTRSNNGTMNSADGTHIAVLVDSLNPQNGVCYAGSPEFAKDKVTIIAPAGTPVPCDRSKGTVNPYPSYITNAGLFGAQTGGGFNSAAAFTPGTTCNGNPCAFQTVDNGFTGRYNTVRPKFSSFSLTDEFDPSDRLHFNFGLRFDRFQYDPSNTLREARPFWLNSFNTSYCHDASVVGSNPVEKKDPTASCAASFGSTFVPATVTGPSAVQAYTVWQPRVAFTYTVNPLSVLRFSYGKYDQAPNAAFEQYDSQQQNLFRQNANFYSLGFTAPTHPIRPEISYNTDLSFEHQVKGTDMSFKITPFYRKTSDQIQQFYLDIKTNFVSGLNVGKQTSDGVEVQFQKGNFSRNGIAALISYAYTNAYVTYTPAGNGATPVTTINQSIAQYNGFTSACAAGGSATTKTQYGNPVCGSTAAQPCYDPTGATTPTTPAACTAGFIANPYYNAQPQGFLDPAGKYAPYSLFAGPAPGAGDYHSFVSPHVATIVLNYKHDKLSVTPALQFSAGTHYGYPIATFGVDPSACGGTLAGTVAGDPRYPYGGSGSPFDAAACGANGATQSVPIPNPATGKFDGIGSFRNPNRFTLATQISYDMSPRLTTVLTLSNLIDTCSGGTKTNFTNAPGVNSNKICGYNGGYSGVGINPIGNNYNPGVPVQQFQRQSYYPLINTLPFNAYIDFKIKI